MTAWLKQACVLIAGVLFGAGQISGAGGLILQGRVTDVRGKAVPGAELQVVDSSGNLRYRALSDIRGIYCFPALIQEPNPAFEAICKRRGEIRRKQAGVANRRLLLRLARFSPPSPPLHWFLIGLNTKIGCCHRNRLLDGPGHQLLQGHNVLLDDFSGG